jgi:hypothetical protein
MTSKPPKNPGRQSTDIITKENLEEFIATQDDFALELYAYSLARDLGFAARHAGSYIDPITGKARQFDVQANRVCENAFHVYFAIECKCLRASHPLLISQIPRIHDESYQDIVFTMGRTFPPSRLPSLSPGVYRLPWNRSLYQPNQYVGKSISQVGFNGDGKLSSKDAEVFDKWGQAIASSSQLIKRAEVLCKSLNESVQTSAVLPVLVVPDGTLWVANYSENGTLQEGPTQTDEARYFVGSVQSLGSNPQIPFTISHLHIVTKSGYEQLLRKFMPAGEYAILLQDAMH